MRIFSDAPDALRAAAAAEAAHLAFAAGLARAGGTCRDQACPEETWVLAPARAEASPLLLVGGMGPQAGLSGFAAACRAARGAVVLVQACTVPDRTRAIRAGGCAGARARAGVADALTGAVARAFAAAGRPGRADLIVLCNTAHHALRDVRLPPGVGVLSLVEAAANRARGLSRVLVLATAGTRAGGLYARALARRGVTALSLSPGHEAALTDVIYRGVKAGRLEPAALDLRRLLARLADAGSPADALVLGCTELPLLLPAVGPLPWPAIDPVACALADLARRDAAAGVPLTASPA